MCHAVPLDAEDSFVPRILPNLWTRPLGSADGEGYAMMTTSPASGQESTVVRRQGGRQAISSSPWLCD